MSARFEKTTPQASRPQEPARLPSQKDLQRWIAEAAYYRAERRGFQPGLETEDWLAVEAEIKALLR